MQTGSNPGRDKPGRVSVTWSAVLTLVACGFAVSAMAQVPPPPDNAPGLPAPMTDNSSGAIINKVPPTPRVTDPVPVRPVAPPVAVPSTAAPAPVVPPPSVNPAAGVVPTAPGATGPILRPEIGRSNLDQVQTAPAATTRRNPANNATNSLSPAEAAQRQLMIEREDRMRGLNKVNP